MMTEFALFLSDHMLNHLSHPLLLNVSVPSTTGPESARSSPADPVLAERGLFQWRSISLGLGNNYSFIHRETESVRASIPETHQGPDKTPNELVGEKSGLQSQRRGATPAGE